MPGQGHQRKDLTQRPVLFFPLYSYLVVYQPNVEPIRIMAVLRGTRNVKRIRKHRARSSRMPWRIAMPCQDRTGNGGKENLDMRHDAIPNVLC
jgi:hypothetical protein